MKPEDAREIAGWGGCVLIVAGVLAFAGLSSLSYCSHNPTTIASDTETPAPENKATPTPTPDAALNLRTIGKTSDGSNWACPATREKFDAMMKALAESDNAGYEAAVSDGVALEPGTKVRILDRTGLLGTTVHLRIVSGYAEGRDCWIAGDADGLFQEGP